MSDRSFSIDGDEEKDKRLCVLRCDIGYCRNDEKMIREDREKELDQANMR